MFRKLLASTFIISALCAIPAFAENITLLPDATTKQYTQEDIQNMDLQTMCIARNEIYAKHGRKFVSQELQTWFNNQEWYQGTIEPKDFPENTLNDIEQANVTMMWEYEKSKTDGKGYPVDDESHKQKAQTVDQLSQSGGGWDYSAVYTYLGQEAPDGQGGAVASSFDILEGLQVYSANGSAVMDSNYFTLTVPTNPTVGYNQPDKDSFTIYYADAKKGGFGGVVVTVKAYDIGDTSYNQLQDYKIAGTNDSKIFVAIYPTNVQYNSSDPVQMTGYGTLLNWAKSLDYTSSSSPFKVKTQQAAQDTATQDASATQNTNGGVVSQLYDELQNQIGG